MMNTGKTFVKSNNKMLSTIAWRIDGELTYALEGSVFVAGALIQWLRDKLGIIKNASEVENLANTVDNNGGVTFIPALSGLAAPAFAACLPASPCAQYRWHPRHRSGS